MSKQSIYEGINLYSITYAEAKEWIDKGNKIGIYGAGTYGQQWCEILQRFSIEVFCFLDNNRRLWGQNIVLGVPCYNPELFSEREDCLFFVSVGCVLLPSILERIKEQKIRVVQMNDIVDDLIINYPEKYYELLRLHSKQEYTELFYIHDDERNENAPSAITVSKERIAVYTGIFGGYDTYDVPAVFPTNIDYYLISDQEQSLPDGVEWIDSSLVLPREITSPIKQNRYVKMHGHEIFNNYRYSIYLDGCVHVEGNLTGYLPREPLGISVFQHPLHDSIYYEALNQTNNNRVDVDDTIMQMSRYIAEGMPIHIGMGEMGVIGRDHHCIEGNRLMEEWWEEFCQGAMRDQFSFAYVLWKNHFGFSNLSMIGKNRYKALEIKTLLHPRNSSDEKK